MIWSAALQYTLINKMTSQQLTLTDNCLCYMINVNIPYFTWIFTVSSAVILIQNVSITLSPVVNSINVMISLRYGRVSYSRPLAGGTCWSQRWYLHGVSTILAVAAFTALAIGQAVFWNLLIGSRWCVYITHFIWNNLYYYITPNISS